jgi:hypothetical protein
MSETRSQLLSRSFRETSLKIGDRILRAPTAGSIDLLQQSGNPLFSEQQSETDENPGDLLPLFEFIWIHSAPLDEVLAAADIEGEIKRQARKLAFVTPLEDVTEFAAGFQTLQTRLQAAMTEAVPEEGDEGKPVTSPTGSPSSSLPLAGQGTQTASATSSGNSRLSDPSSTSTPPSATTETPAASLPTSNLPETRQPTPLPPFSPSANDGL